MPGIHFVSSPSHNLFGGGPELDPASYPAKPLGTRYVVHVRSIGLPRHRAVVSPHISIAISTDASDVDRREPTYSVYASVTRLSLYEAAVALCEQLGPGDPMDARRQSECNAARPDRPEVAVSGTWEQVHDGFTLKPCRWLNSGRESGSIPARDQHGAGSRRVGARFFTTDP